MTTERRERAQAGMNAEFQLLRAQVENGVNGPAVIVVTSAENGDGKSLTAYSLAECLARSGRKTALLDATSASPLTSDRPLLVAGESTRGESVKLALPSDGPGISREVISDFFASARAEFDFTIVDTSALLASDRAIALAGLADGILLSVRLGRPATENDRMTVQFIEESHGTILGVVATTGSAVKLFEDRREDLRAQPLKPLAGERRAIVTEVSIARQLIGSALVLGLSCCLVACGYFAVTAPDRALGIAPQPARVFVDSIVAHFRARK
jgi:Mrp family chromosome partitioning ATPase